MTPSKGNFLKAIIKLGGGECQVNNKDIAKELQISSAAVTDMAQKLLLAGYIHYAPYKGIEITETGKKETNKLIRKHRLWEVFLYDKLGYKWNQVHDDAGLLEHVSSDFLIAHLDEFLGFPKSDPHGEFIPNAEGIVQPSNTFPLNEIPVGKTFTIKKISEDPGLLEHLAHHKIALLDTFKLIEIEKYEGAFVLEDENGSQKRISQRTATFINVQVNEWRDSLSPFR